MDKTFKYEIINEAFAYRSPEQREEIEQRASELVKDKDFSQAAEILGNSQTLDETKIASKRGWLAALAVAVCTVAVSIL